MNGRPKVYMGRDGFHGVSKIRRTSYLEKMVGPQKNPSVCIGSGGVSTRTVLAAGGIVGGGMVRVRPVTAKSAVYMGGKGPAAAKVSEGLAGAALKVVKPRFPIIPPKRAEEKPRELEAEKVDEKVTSPKESLAECNPPMDERGKGTKPEVGMTETEERMADFLGAAQEVVSAVEKENPKEVEFEEVTVVEPKPIVNDLEITLCDGSPKAEEEKPAEMEEAEVAEAVEAEKSDETGAAISELPLGAVSAAEAEEGGKKRRRRKGRKARESTEMSEERRAIIQAEVEAASDAAANNE